MGKAKKASAASAAAAMQKAGFSTGTFVGFDAFSPAAPTNQVERANEQHDESSAEWVSSYYDGQLEELKGAFKGLAKKDAQTRVKAMNDVITVVEDPNTPKADIRPALRHFYYHFLRMGTKEFDHRVREKGLSTLGSFAVAVPKIVSKSALVVLSEVLIFTEDSMSQEVRRAALNCLQKIVPKDPMEKEQFFASAVGPVANELRSRVRREDPSQETEDKENSDRIQANAIGGITAFIKFARAEDYNDLLERVLGPNTKQVMKKLLSSQSSLVRVKTYELISTLSRPSKSSQQIPSASSILSKEIISQICNGLVQESETDVLRNNVDALLSTMAFLRNSFFDTIDAQKVFFPALWKMLRVACKGAGAHVYPTMLPMLSLTPTKVFDEFSANGIDLGNKWLEEMAAAMTNQDSLGPHNMPILLDTVVECQTFLLKKKWMVHVPVFSEVMKFYVREPKRFMISKNLHLSIHNCLTQVMDQDPGKDDLNSLLKSLFWLGQSESERVARILAGSGDSDALSGLSQSLCQESVEDNRLRLTNPVSLGLLMKSSQVPLNSERRQAVVTNLAGRLAVGSAPIPIFHVFLQVLLQSTDSEEQELLWKECLGSPPEKLAVVGYSMYQSLVTAADDILVHGHPEVSILVRAFTSQPTLAGLGLLDHCGWLSQNLKLQTLSFCRSRLEGLIGSVFGSAGDSPEQDWQKTADSKLFLLECAKVAQKLEGEGMASTESSECLGTVILANAIIDMNSAVKTDSSEVATWLSSWLKRTLIGGDRDWAIEPLASKVWAHVAVQFKLVNEVLISLDTAVAKLVQVAMHISEEKSDGELLGFSEPAPLLWKLLVFSIKESDWRDAVLIPYIVADLSRLEGVLQHAVQTENEKDFSHLGGVLSFALQVHGSNADGCIERSLLPRLSAVECPIVVVNTVTLHAGGAISRLGMYPKLARFWASMILEGLPAERVQWCVGIAEDFIGQVDSQEQGCEDLPNLDGEVISSELENGEKEEALESDETFEEGEKILYVKEANVQPGTIRAVHRDDPHALYYTVHLTGGREVQTTSQYLRPQLVKPKTLDELNQLLAIARRAGDHKESLRLMKLQPSLLPKPVDSDQAKKEALAAARKRRERALENLAEIKRKGWNQSSGVGGSVSAPLGNAEHGQGSDGGKQIRVAPDECGRRLQCLAALCQPKRQIRMGNDELKSLLTAAAGLETLLSYRTIPIQFRQFDTSDPNVDLLLGALQILYSLVSNVRADALSSELRTYFDRTITSTILLAQRTDLRFLHLCYEIVKSLPLEDPLRERGLELLLPLFVEEVTSEQQILNPTMVSLVSEIPIECIQELEVSLSPSKTLLSIFVAQFKNNSLKLKSLDLFGMCCKSSDQLVKGWWEQRQILHDCLHLSKELAHERRHVASLEIDGSEIEVEEDEDEEPLFDPFAWCFLLQIIRRIRILEPDAKEEIAERMQELDIGENALAWSIFGPTFSTDHLRQTVALLTLRVLPAISRRWYTDSGMINQADVSMVRDRLGKFVSPRIVAEEMFDIDQADKEHLFEATNTSSGTGDGEDSGTLSVSTSVKARTVTALYEKEDCAVEIKIILPITFPLQSVEVQCSRQVGIKQERWRRMVLQITTMLATQDATLVDAITFWKFNMDKEFEGMEPCPICYAVVHATDQSLPKLRCSTCKNSFHAKCLVKWFKTSHKNDCPLCKQPF